jgi:hypothetical protein
VFPEDTCSKGGTLQVPIETPGGPGTRVVAGGGLLNLRIERNRIRNMGLCGIGPAGFFNLPEEFEVISIANLTIESNEITRTLLRDINFDQLSTRLSALSIIGYGAICITDAESLTIRENNVNEFGVQPGADVCGIFLLNGEMVEISGNHVLEPRDWSKASETALTATGGPRGGIVIAMATPPAFTSDYAYSHWNVDTNLAAAQLPSFIPSMSALRVENNTVRVPLGIALEAVGLGAFAIQNNHLSCGGTVPQKDRSLAATVAIMNMGTAIEAAAAANFSSLNKKGNAGAYESVAQRGLINSSTGAVLFTGNICQLEARASRQRVFSSLVVFTLDHMIFADNQCWVDGPRSTAIVDVLAGAGSLQLTSNRFQESTGFPVFASGLTVGLINIATQNLSTYCLINLGSVKLVEANNVALIDLAGQDICAQFTKQMRG